MARANAAYYATRDPFTDFTTAPEIAQVFGELLGLWAAVVWQSMGSPSPVLLAEAGPGRGTLMADALRAAARAAPAFRAALSVHLIETSLRLRDAQANALGSASWHEDLESVPCAPLLLIANEFLDALPIRQLVRRGDRWSERFVCDGRFVERDAVAGLAGLPPAPDGGVVEVGSAARAFVQTLARRLARDGGAALIVDYGPSESAPGESLQALKHGRAADPLDSPGEADLTAHVDFAALAEIARDAGASVRGPVPQGVFLTRLGLFERTGVLARTQPPLRAAALIEAARRLAEPDRMGRLFKAMAICHPDLPSPPGFSE
ncbi:MAG TPA: SAM-dependent methyltransferase [Acetobacteraceae bacterium]|nr:SAM-dependent methyltransferase [Acetobacteraceae bacterium]